MMQRLNASGPTIEIEPPRRAASMRDGRRGAGLLERMRCGECLIAEAGRDYSVDGRIRRQVAIEQLRADRVADQTNVGDGHLIAMTIAAGRAIARQMSLERLEALRDPMADPFEPRRLVEPELAFQIGAHPRHQQRVAIAR